MNDGDIDRLLKSVKVPERTDQYWREFPKKITTKLHGQPQVDSNATARHEPWLRPALAFAGIAIICVAVGLYLRQFGQHKNLSESSPELAAARKCYQELEELFPNQVRAIVFDEHGPQMVLAAKADVPKGPAVFLKICGPKGCESFVTFSGQEISVNGEKCEVLANGNGQVVLMGSHEVWTGNDSKGDLRVESRML